MNMIVVITQIIITLKDMTLWMFDSSSWFRPSNIDNKILNIIVLTYHVNMFIKIIMIQMKHINPFLT